MLVFGGENRGSVKKVQFISNTLLLAHYSEVGFRIFDIPNQSLRYENDWKNLKSILVLPNGDQIVFSSAEDNLFRLVLSEPKTTSIPRLSRPRNDYSYSYPNLVWYQPGNALLVSPGKQNPVAFDGANWEPREDLGEILHLGRRTLYETINMHWSGNGRWAIVQDYSGSIPSRLFELPEAGSGTEIPLPIRIPRAVSFSSDDKFAIAWKAFKLYSSTWNSENI